MTHIQRNECNTHTHTTILLLFWSMSGTTRVSMYQRGKTGKVKTNLDLLEQEVVSGSGICLAICKSAPHPRQPRQHPTTQFFTGWMPFLPPNQQCQYYYRESVILLKVEVRHCISVPSESHSHPSDGDSFPAITLWDCYMEFYCSFTIGFNKTYVVVSLNTTSAQILHRPIGGFSLLTATITAPLMLSGMLLSSVING